jgi:hypothetical protein
MIAPEDCRRGVNVVNLSAGDGECKGEQRGQDVK